MRDSIIRPLYRPIITAINRQHDSSGYTPASLFAAGEQGAWYDPSDLSTMFQDAAGTTPVTTANQQVGLILDKSGNNNHASQPTGANRPILRQSGALWFLEFDGVNDFLVTPTINFTTQSEMSIFAGVAKITDAAAGMLCELSPTIDSNNFAFAILAPDAAAAATYRAQFKGTLLSECLAIGYAAPTTHVVTAVCSIDFNQFLRVNGTLVPGNNLQGGGNFGAYPIYIGMRAGTSLPYRGYIASMIIRGKYSTGQTITDAEKYVADKSGVVM